MGAEMVIAALLVAGCGGGPRSQHAAPQPADPALRLYNRMAAALAHVRSLHLTGWYVDRDGRTTLSMDIGLPGRLRAHFRTARSSFDFVQIGAASYFRGDRAFWVGAAGGRGRRFAGHWIKSPPGSFHLESLSVVTHPATISRCLIGPHFGTLRLAGRAEVAGRRARVIRDLGDRPGAGPGRLYVAADGPPLPLRVTLTGPEKPGARPDRACRETPEEVRNLTKAGELRLGGYGRPVHITAPHGALDLSQLSPGAGEQAA